MTMKDTERDHKIGKALQESAEAKNEAADVVQEWATRLERLAEEMRRRGPFPLAGQLERERIQRKQASNDLASR